MTMTGGRGEAAMKGTNTTAVEKEEAGKGEVMGGEEIDTDTGTGAEISDSLGGRKMMYPS